MRITMIISSLTLQDIKQNVSETLADQGIFKKEPLSNFLPLFKQISCQNSKQLGIAPFSNFWIVLRHLALIQFRQFRLQPSVDSCDT